MAYSYAQFLSNIALDRLTPSDDAQRIVAALQAASADPKLNRGYYNTLLLS